MFEHTGGLREVAEMTDAEVLDLLRELERDRAVLDAVRVRALARMAQLRPDRDAGGHYFAGAEVGVALAWTPAQAATQVALAARLVTTFPDTVDALGRGHIDLARAHALVDITTTLPDDQAVEVQHWILARTQDKTIEQWRQALRAKKDRIDPEGADRRREQRRQQRRVDFHIAEDGMAHLDCYDTGERLRAVYLLVDKMARTLRAHGATEPLAALRADALHDLVFGNGNGATVELQVAIPYTVLLGAHLGGTLDGYGPIPNIAIKELITEHDNTWRRIITDPVGKVLEISARRHPGADLTRHIRLRDQTCRYPGCHRPTVSTEIDHTIPHSHGGTTSADNLGCLCPLHHKIKDQPGWHLRQTRPGLFIWTTPTGQHHTVEQTPLIEFDAPIPGPRDPRRLIPTCADPPPF
jgi:hypothetical protein